MGSPTVVNLDQQYNVEERPSVILYTYINCHARPSDTTKTKDYMSCIQYITKKVVIIYDNTTNNHTALGAWVNSKMLERKAVEPYNKRGCY